MNAKALTATRTRNQSVENHRLNEAIAKLRSDLHAARATIDDLNAAVRGRDSTIKELAEENKALKATKAGEAA